jgi:hypothetical protein
VGASESGVGLQRPADAERQGLHRVQQIAASSRASQFAIEDLRRTPATPAMVAEHYRLAQARVDGEATWARSLLTRLRAGEYWFEGEPDRPWNAPEAPADGGEAAA